MGEAVDTRGVLRIADESRIRLMTLDRPGALNAFNDALYDAVRDGLVDAAARPDIAVVVITGAGRAFTAGQDLGELAKRPSYDDGARHGFLPFIEIVESFPKPLMAAVNGIGVGIGLTLLLHCDQVLIAEEARLRVPFVSLGVTAEAGSSVLLPERIGRQEAAHLLFTSNWLPADRAVALGLALRAVPAVSLLEAAMELAREVAAMPIASLVATKELLRDAHLDAVRAARAREGTAWASLEGGPAVREALAAFRERRPPDFTNLPEA